MEQKKIQCPFCEELNTETAEFCKKCSKPLPVDPVFASSLMVNWTHKAIDAMFWVVDETARLWEIGRLSVKLKTLRRRRISLSEKPAFAGVHGLDAEETQDDELLNIIKELEDLASREEFLRSRCWAYTPALFFVLLIIAFIYALLSLNPGIGLLPLYKVTPDIFTGEVIKVRDLPLTNHKVITSSVWFDNKLYIGGDGGLTVLDPVSGLATPSSQLPPDFFVRDMAIDNEKLFIAGFSGVYVLEKSLVKPFFNSNVQSFSLINSLAVINDDSLLLGTVGEGLFKASRDKYSLVSGTKEKNIKEFGRLGNDLWLMCENGIMTGRGDRYSNFTLQLLTGRHLRCMVTTNKNVYIGTDQGVVAGYRNPRNWVWTLLSAGEPGLINDFYLTGDILFIASEEGLFRFSKGRMERVSSLPSYALAAGNSFLAAVNPNSVMLYYFSGSSDTSLKTTGAIPEIGTFTYPISVVSAPPSFGSSKLGRMPELFSKEATFGSSASKSNVASLELPVDLQKPVFVDVLKLADKYILSTENRGIWLYEHDSWQNLSTKFDFQTINLVTNQKNIFACSNEKGVYKIEDYRPTLLVSSDHTKHLVSFCVDEQENMFLLYQNGNIINRTPTGSFREYAAIPAEFHGFVHSIWSLSGKLLAVVDRGVLVYEYDKQWNLFFFKGRFENSSVVSVAQSADGYLYVALKDGRIFKYFDEKLLLLGAISGQPVSINFDSVLWVSTNDSLFFYEDNKFVYSPYHPQSSVIGAFTDLNSSSVFVFSSSGLEVLSEQ